MKHATRRQRIVLGWVFLFAWLAASLPACANPVTEKLMAQARELQVQKRWQASLSLLESVIALEPGLLAARRMRGVALLRLSRFAEARRDLDHVVRVDANDWEAWRLRGDLHYRSGEYDLAIGDLSQAIRLRPDPSCYWTRADTHMRLGQYLQAEMDYATVLRLRPSDVYARHNRGCALLALQEFARAESDFNEVIRLKPDAALAYRNRGLVFASQGEYARALADFDHAVSLHPRNAMSIYRRGEMHELLGHSEEARRDFAQAYAIDPHIMDYVLTPATYRSVDF